MKDEHFATVFFGIIAILIMFVVPVVLVGYNRRLSAETKANEIIEEFIDDCRATAYFTENGYEDLQTKLDALGCRWDVSIYHYSTQYEADANGKVYTYEVVYDTKEIGDKLYEDMNVGVAKYEMKYGDKIEVKAVSKTEFMGVNFASLFVGGLENRIIIDLAEQIDNNAD